MRGIASGTIKFKAVCKCMVCGAEEFSSQDNSFDTGRVEIDDLIGRIEVQFGNGLVQPPLGWAIYGRGNYKCEKHIT